MSRPSMTRKKSFARVESAAQLQQDPHYWDYLAFYRGFDGFEFPHPARCAIAVQRR